MKFIKNITLSLTAFLLTTLGFSQSQVSGKVTDASNGEGLPGVTVAIKGTTTGDITDINGSYSLSASAEDILVFSYIGFETQEILVGNQTTIDVQLSFNVDDLEEVVVLGYYSQKKSDLTGAVATISADDIDESPYSNVLQNLQGRVAGATVIQDGQPGGGRTRIRIRGASTTNVNDPLYVIDGVPTEESIDFLNSNDIESIQVLKDASAASIYGSRASNGVIVITTKKGKEGKTSINAGVVLGTQSVINTVDVLNATEWGQMYWQASANSGQTPNIGIYGGRVADPAILVNIPFKTPPNEAYPDGQTYVFTEEGTNWADEIYRSAKNNQFYVTISSGSDKTTSSFGLSYFDQEGIIDKTYYQRITARANTSYKIDEAIEVGQNLSVAWSDQVQVGTQSGGGVPYTAIRQHPALPIFDLDGNFAGGNTLVGGLAFPNVANPVSELERNKDNNSISWRIFGNGYASVDIMKYINAESNHSLNLKTNYGLDYSTFDDYRFFRTFTEGGLANPTSTLFRNEGTGLTTTWTNTLEYQYGTVKHNIRVLLGHEVVDYEFDRVQANATEFLIEDPNYVVLTRGEGGSPEEEKVERGLRSYFGRLDYSFLDKYLIGATVRYDETSRFNNDGIFPAFSFGWRASDESFLAPVFSNNILKSTKVRLSWGQQGNQFGRNYPSFSTYTTANSATDDIGADYNFSGDNTTVSTGLITQQIGNPGLRWETSTQTNLGFDIGMFDNLLQLVVDVYTIDTEDIIRTGQRISAEGEGDDPLINALETQTKGFEAEVQYNFLSKLTNWDAFTSLQFTTNNTKITAISPESVLIDNVTGEQYIQRSNIHRARVGGDLGTYYGYFVDGIFQNQSEVDAHADQPGKAPGRLKYRDISGPEGVPDGVINDFDRGYLGSFQPDFTLGWNAEVSWKNISLGMFWYGSFGNEVYNFTKQNTDFFEPNFNSGAKVLNAWTPENPGSSIPAVQTVATNDERRTSSYFIEDGSFIKLRSLRIGYSLPEKITGRARVNFYAEGQNLLIISDYDGLDPELPFADNSNLPGVDLGIYPIPRILLFGMNIKL